MKIALAQIDTTVGDCAGNLQLVERALDKGRQRGVDLVVFPEQTLPGYPAEDLLERRDFLAQVAATFDQAADACRGIAMVIGTVVRTDEDDGNRVYNSAALVADGEVKLLQHKTLLPTYDVFDEGRYFRSASEHDVVEFGGRKVGLAVCEDLWNDTEFWLQRRYPADPVAALVAAGADLIVSISASPFSVGRPAFRQELLANAVRRYRVPIVYCNLVGGNTSLVFDGNSLALDERGELLAVSPAFDEDFRVFDLDSSKAVSRPARLEPPAAHSAEIAASTLGSVPMLSDADVEGAYRAMVLGTRDYLHKSGFQSAVLGLSGGIDSALTAAVAADAMGAENVIGVAMPSRYSSEGSVVDARALAENLGIALHEIPIESIFAATLDTLAPVFAGLDEDVTEENIQARIRGLLVMALSNKLGALLLTTGNKSELAVGYCTLYGDMSGGLAVISDVPKTLVYRIARWLNRDGEIIPSETIDKPPSAELRPDQVDQDSLPPYDVLDAVLEGYVEKGMGVDEIAACGFDAELVRRILYLVDLNEYKRKQAAPGLRVTSKAFGPGRRFPIVKRQRRT